MKYDDAIAKLTISAEVCEHNAPIHAAEGNQEQADFSSQNAKAYRAAIEELTR